MCFVLKKIIDEKMASKASLERSFGVKIVILFNPFNWVK
jgi:hypothetical protein